MSKNKNKKICVLTGTRAEYGLFYPLLKELKEAQEFALQIIATGMHLSPEFGLTYREIEKDGFDIDEKVEMLLSSDTEVGISKSIGLGVIGVAEALQRLKPDLLVLLGDRFETLSAAIAALVANIPVVHLFGGEITEGAIDEAIRHSITKMSHLHLTSAEAYRARVIQLGEAPDRVFNVGALNIDNIVNMKLLTRKQTESSLKIKFQKHNLLVTFHPVTIGSGNVEFEFREVLKALDRQRETLIIFTKPNADTFGRIIIRMIDEYVNANSSRSVAFTSMGQLRYLSALKHVDAVVGNSSSGIFEAPSFCVPTVNIGERQRGRLRSESIIDCNATAKEISAAIKKALSPEFRRHVRKVESPYGDGTAARKILSILKQTDFSKRLLQKKFFDINNSYGELKV